MKRPAHAQEGDNADAGNPQDDDTYGGEQESEKSGTLDADGKLQITVPTKVDSKKQDLVYRIEARVTDAGNREIAGHGFALATYGSFFLTAEPNSYVYTKGSTATVTVTAQDYDKKPVQTSFQVEMNRLGLAQRRGTVGHHIARPNRRQRQGAGQAHHPRCRRISRARDRDHAGESHRRDHRVPLGSGRESVVERPGAGARADRSRQEDAISRATRRMC